ncbi:hypothetical protein [Paraburkholderia sp. J8-2]|uniref:hypothetical protein n=1 Tax=Paraburkholderia sp. J8-2 TaxID=2805440 RepID=UPI002AB65C3A|nr:hypothetical protein [Paraburkholderia sp. J8-2]
MALLPPLTQCENSFPAGYSYMLGNALAVANVGMASGEYVLYSPPSLTTWSEIQLVPTSYNLSTTATTYYAYLSGPSYDTFYSSCGNQEPYVATGYTAVCQVDASSGQLNGWILLQNGMPFVTDSNPNCGAN